MQISSLYHLLEPEIVQCLFQFAQPRLRGDALYFLLDSEKYCSSEMERADSCPRKVSLIKSLPELCCVSGSPTVMFGYVYRPIPPQCSPYMGFLADKTSPVCFGLMNFKHYQYARFDAWWMNICQRIFWPWQTSVSTAASSDSLFWKQSWLVLIPRHLLLVKATSAKQ